MDGEERWHAAPGPIDGPQQVAGALGGDHPDVDDAGWVDPSEMDVETMGEHQQVAGPQVRCDLVVVDALLGRVRDEDHDDVRGLDRIGDIGDPEARLGGQGAAPGPGRERHDDIDPGVVEVEGVGMALAAVADDRDRLAGEGRQICVVVVVHLGRHRLIASSIEPEPRAITTAPVRTNSLMP